MRFCKMNGIGNDYIFVYQPEECIINPCRLSQILSDRHFSVGADGLVLIDESDVADFSMRIFNADGSEANMCGNAIRCLALYVTERGLTCKDIITVKTRCGIKELRLKRECGRVTSVRVNMGRPRYMSVAGFPAGELTVPTYYGDLTVIPVDIGNYHAVIFTETLDDRMMEIAKEVSHSPLFPDGINAEIVKVTGAHALTMRVYERGSGETLACGTGATASAYAAITSGMADSPVEVTLRGGKLKITLEDGVIFMEGGAQINFEGEVEI